MDNEFMLSLRRFIVDNLPELKRVVLLEDGMNLSEIPKPFAVIEPLGLNDTIVAAGRVAHNEIYRYQIAIYANSLAERGTLHKSLRTLLSTPDGIPHLQLSGVPSGNTFVVDVGIFTPMTADDNSDLVRQHYGYIDVEIDIYRDYGESTFTQ